MTTPTPWAAYPGSQTAARALTNIAWAKIAAVGMWRYEKKKTAAAPIRRVKGSDAQEPKTASTVYKPEVSISESRKVVTR